MTTRAQFRDDPGFWRDAPSGAPRQRGANISIAGNHNRKLILTMIRAKGETTRLALAAETGLTPTAIFKIARDLVEDGLVLASRSNEKTRGQPSSLMRLNPDAAWSLGLNIERDRLTAVAVDFGGKARFRLSRNVSFADTGIVLTLMREVLAHLTERHDLPLSRFVGLGVAIPDDQAALDGADPGFAGLVSAKAGDRLRGLTDRPVTVESDTAAAAMGELLLGTGLEADTFVYLYVGAGLGAGLVVNGHYIRGAHGRSGGIGALPKVNLLKPSQTNLQKTLGDACLVSDLLRQLAAVGGHMTEAGAWSSLNAEAEQIVDRWINQAADFLYLPMLNAICLVDPDRIVVGGDLPEPIAERFCEVLSRRLSMHVGIHWPGRAARPGRLTSDPAAVGAASLALRDMWEPFTKP